MLSELYQAISLYLDTTQDRTSLTLTCKDAYEALNKSEHYKDILKTIFKDTYNCPQEQLKDYYRHSHTMNVVNYTQSSKIDVDMKGSLLTANFEVCDDFFYTTKASGIMEKWSMKDKARVTDFKCDESASTREFCRYKNTLFCLTNKNKEKCEVEQILAGLGFDVKQINIETGESAEFFGYKKIGTKGCQIWDMKIKSDCLYLFYSINRQKEGNLYLNVFDFKQEKWITTVSFKDKIKSFEFAAELMVDQNRILIYTRDRDPNYSMATGPYTITLIDLLTGKQVAVFPKYEKKVAYDKETLVLENFIDKKLCVYDLNSDKVVKNIELSFLEKLTTLHELQVKDGLIFATFYNEKVKEKACIYCWDWQQSDKPISSKKIENQMSMLHVLSYQPERYRGSDIISPFIMTPSGNDCLIWNPRKDSKNDSQVLKCESQVIKVKKIGSKFFVMTEKSLNWFEPAPKTESGIGKRKDDHNKVETKNQKILKMD